MTHRERHIAEGLFELKQKPGPGLCCVKGCRNDAAPKKMSLCHRHSQHRWRLKSPKQSAYAALRDHARERRIAFTISFDYFQGLTDAYARYFHEPENRGEVLTIDRVRADRGYEPGNLTVMPHSSNVAKGNRERHLPAYVQSILARKRARVQDSDCPDLSRDEAANPF